MNKKYKYIDEIPCCFCTFVKPKFAWFEKFFNLREKKHHECHFICSRCYDKYYQELGFYSKKCIKEASIDNITGKEDKPPYWIPCDEKQWERLKKVIVSIEEKMSLEALNILSREILYGYTQVLVYDIKERKFKVIHRLNNESK